MFLSVQLYQSIPHVLLPVVPHLTSELQSSDGTKRLEAVQLLSKLFSLPGSKLVTDYGDVLDALLGRYQDTKVSCSRAYARICEDCSELFSYTAAHLCAFVSGHSL